MDDILLEVEDNMQQAILNMEKGLLMLEREELIQVFWMVLW